MKTLLTIFALLIALPSFAADLTKLGFRAYSTPTPVTCTVFAHADKQKTDNFTTRAYSLGNKGFGNFSTVMSSGRWNNITFTCVDTGTSTARRVKVFFNAVETHFLTLDTSTIYSGR